MRIQPDENVFTKKSSTSLSQTEATFRKSFVNGAGVETQPK
jgi:hypothetical protein